MNLIMDNIVFLGILLVLGAGCVWYVRRQS